MAKLTNSEKRKLALGYYVNEGMSQKLIAEKVKVSQNTITTWKEQDKWDMLKGASLTTAAAQLQMFYTQLNNLNIAITTREGVGKEAQRYATPAEGDTIIKLTAAIKNIQKDAGIAEVISVCTKFLEHVGNADLAFAQKLSSFVDDFVKSYLRNAA